MHNTEKELTIEEKIRNDLVQIDTGAAVCWSNISTDISLIKDYKEKPLRLILRRLKRNPTYTNAFKPLIEQLENNISKALYCTPLTFSITKHNKLIKACTSNEDYINYALSLFHKYCDFYPGDTPIESLRTFLLIPHNEEERKILGEFAYKLQQWLNDNFEMEEI